MPLPAHRRLLHCTTRVQGLDSEICRMIILIPKPSSLKLPLPFLLTPRLHYLLISSPQKCTARSEKPLKSSAVSSLSRAPVLSCSLFAVFFLVSLFRRSFSSLCQSCMPITTKPTCAEQVIPFSGEPRRGRKGEKCGEGHKGAYWGRAKHTICNRSDAVGYRLT